MERDKIFDSETHTIADKELVNVCAGKMDASQIAILGAFATVAGLCLTVAGVWWLQNKSKSPQYTKL